jgi:basic membrane protein A
MSRLARSGALCLLVALVAACGSQPATPTGGAAPASGGGAAKPSGAATLKVAMILPGPIQDADFNMLGAQALDEVKRQTGAETAFSESVAVADAERVAREYLNSGYNVVAFHGAQFLTTLQKLGPDFPNAAFVMVSSANLTDLPPNVWNIERKFYEGFYPIGVLAASTSQSHKLGYVSGVRLPEFVSSLNAVKQAAQDTAPNTEVVYAFVGDQNDPVKAREAAASQINSGVDFIVGTVNLGVNGVAEAARAAPRPVLFSTFYTEKKDLAPDRLTVSLLTDFGTPYLQAVRGIQGGQRGGHIEMRPGNGFTLSEIKNAPPDAAQKAREAFDAIAAGRKSVQNVTDKVLGE